MTDLLSNDIKAFQQKDSTINFLKAADSFIKLLEIDNIAKEQYYKKVLPALINLYVAGHQLEEIELKYSSADSDFGKTDEDFFKNQNQGKIANLEQRAFYWEVFDPYEDAKEMEGTQGWLVDDFADIYRDLKIEFEKMKLGTDEAVEDALWHMKWGFVHHWGQHCISALRALHFLWYGGQFLE